MSVYLYLYTCFGLVWCLWMHIIYWHIISPLSCFHNSKASSQASSQASKDNKPEVLLFATATTLLLHGMHARTTPKQPIRTPTDPPNHGAAPSCKYVNAHRHKAAKLAPHPRTSSHYRKKVLRVLRVLRVQRRG